MKYQRDTNLYASNNSCNIEARAGIFADISNIDTTLAYVKIKKKEKTGGHLQVPQYSDIFTSAVISLGAEYESRFNGATDDKYKKVL